MKKGFLRFAITALAAALCFGAAGCTEHETDPEAFSSEIVTAEVWDFAFRDDNFENYRMYVSMLLEGDDGTNQIGTCTKDGNKLFMEWVTTETHTHEAKRYCEKLEDGTVLCYETEPEWGWVWQEAYDLGYYASFQNPAIYFLETVEQVMGADLRERGFALFSYEKEQKGYIYTRETLAQKDTATVKFRDGKVAAILWHRMEGETMTGNYTFTIAYDKQTVTRPQVGEAAE